jgi:two-component system sensor kinase FixL
MEGALAADEASVEVSIAPGLPEVSGDAIQLQQVLVNVIRNALDAVRGRDRRIITVTASRLDERRLELRVRDSGEGLPAGREEAIFRSFETSKAEGMGMGLAICREIITKHNGTIRAENAPGGGAEFVVALPALDAPKP